MGYQNITENCYFKTGRDGVVFEALDNLRPNLFDNNKAIDNSIFSRSSKFRFTIVDSRKAEGKGRALYYNVDPDEMLLLNYLLADGNPALLKKRLGAFGQLNGQEQMELKSIVESFYGFDLYRFNNVLDCTTGKEATSVTLQKNILDSNSPNRLIVKKISFSYEEGIKGSSKYKITIEDGEGLKDESKGSGLNIVANGSYKMLDKTFLMVTRGELLIPISEAVKRIFLAQHSFYGMMKQAEADFKKKKHESEDFDGERIDIWNPAGKPKFTKQKPTVKDAPPPRVAAEPPKEATQTQTPEGKVELHCADCTAVIDSNVHDFSKKSFGRPLCLNCQKQAKRRAAATATPCVECGAATDEKVSSFSQKKFGKTLCISCQKKQ